MGKDSLVIFVSSLEIKLILTNNKKTCKQESANFRVFPANFRVFPGDFRVLFSARFERCYTTAS